MSNKALSLLAALLFAATGGCAAPAPVKTVTIPAEAAKAQDATQIVRQTIENAPRSGVKIVFPKGIYNFYPELAFGEYRAITNHTNGYKYIAVNLSGMRDVEIEGNGSEFIFHGTMMPLLLDRCANVTVRNVSIDWKVPFTVQGEVTATDEKAKSYDLRMYTSGYSWQIEGDCLQFPVDQNFTYSSAGESLVFDKTTHGPVWGSGLLDIHRRTDVRAVKQKDGTVRIFESAKIKSMPPIGSVMTFKGPMGENRYAPAIHCLDSEHVRIENVTVYHALGMGFLGEKSKDITLKKFDVRIRPGSDRMISATADATHFCNCRGDVLVEGCLFENMLDDGTNVHGTYLVIDEVLGPRQVRARLQHFQQAGFTFGEKGDKVWLIVSPNTARGNENTIAQYKAVNEFYAEITFAADLPKGIKKDDLIENKTWNTDSFTLRDCTMRNHRARNIVLKAPNKVLIENNNLQSMMSSILVRGEMFFWMESGASTDVTIRGNRFEGCMLGGGKDGAVLCIQPRMRKDFDGKQLFDRNITFENNTVKAFDNCIIHAALVENFTMRGNVIIHDGRYASHNPDEPLVNIANCKNAVIEGNGSDWKGPVSLKLDAQSQKTAVVKENKW